MDSITIMQGDCLELMQHIPSGSIDMVLCDLPYGTTQCKWDTVIPFEPLWEHYNRIVKPDGAICLFGAEPFASLLRVSNLKNYKYDWIWDKKKGTGFLNAKKQPLRYHEVICVFYRKQCKYNPQMTVGHPLRKSYRSKELQTDAYGDMNRDYYYESTQRYPRSIQSFPMDTQNSSLHPTQKSVALCEYLIRTYTDEGESVLDNCMGSGTTGIACIRTNRNFVGIELDKHYFQIAKQRIENERSEEQ